MKKFVISTHGFEMGIGGLKVLHKLCHLLNENGYDAYLVPFDFNQPFGMYEGYNTKMITQEVLDNLEDTIVVYPESWYGNYLNAPTVVRWMIGPPDKAHVDTWGSDDLWLWYIPFYKSSEFTKHLDNQLYVGEQHRDIFFDRKLERTINSWTLRKAQGLVKEADYKHPKDSLFIPYHAVGDLASLSDIFNISKTFYCYDTYTYLTIQSLLCGAEAVVLPNNWTDKEHFLKGFALSKYVAYGVEDLPRARSIRNEFLEEVEEIETLTIKQLHEFTEKCTTYFK